MKVWPYVNGKHGCWAKNRMVNSEEFRKKDFIKDLLGLNHKKMNRGSQGR